MTLPKILTPDNAKQAFLSKYGDNILKVSEIKDAWGWCCAIYGPPGVGKTPVAADVVYSTYGAPALLLDVEGGVRSVTHLTSKREGVVAELEHLEIMSWRELRAFVSDLIKLPADAVPWKSLIIDNMSEIQSMCLEHYAGTSAASISNYRDAGDAILDLTRDLRDFARSTWLNVIFIAWDNPNFTDAETNTRITEMGFTPALARQFPGLIDTIGHLTVHSNKPPYPRKLSFAPSSRNRAKFRASLDDVLNNIPLEIVFGRDEHPMADIMNTIRGGMPWPKEKYSKYQSNIRQANQEGESS